MRRTDHRSSLAGLSLAGCNRPGAAAGATRPSIKVAVRRAEAASPARRLQSRDRRSSARSTMPAIPASGSPTPASSAPTRTSTCGWRIAPTSRGAARDWAVFAGPGRKRSGSRLQGHHAGQRSSGLRDQAAERSFTRAGQACTSNAAEIEPLARLSRGLHWRVSLYSPVADRSLTVTQLPWRTSSRQLPSGLVTRLPPWARACRP